MIYLKTKKEFDCLLEANNMINIIFDKINNQASNKIFNMTIFTKDHKFFLIFYKLTSIIKIKILEKIDQFTKLALKMVNSIAINIYSLECII